MKNLINLRHGRLLSVLAMAVALVGCGGGGDGSTSATSEQAPPVVSATDPGATPPVSSPPVSTTPPVTSPPVTTPPPVSSPPVVTNPPVKQPPVDGAPQITGAAVTTAKVGQSYRFQPRATDSDSATLTFAISNAPKWATFNTKTGLLSGTPTTADVGMTQNIVVQVTDGTKSDALAGFSITVAAVGGSTGSASLSWQAPTENTDGSTLSNLGGYVIHYGTASKVYTSSITVSNPGLTSYVVEDLPPGKYFFSMNATSTSGTQSGASAEASITIS